MPITKEEKLNIITEFGKGSQDTGSSQVQVALLTKNIIKLTAHCQKNPKDFSTRRGLLQMVCDRRSFLRRLYLLRPLRRSLSHPGDPADAGL